MPRENTQHDNNECPEHLCLDGRIHDITCHLSNECGDKNLIDALSNVKGKIPYTNSVLISISDDKVVINGKRKYRLTGICSDGWRNLPLGSKKILFDDFIIFGSEGLKAKKHILGCFPEGVATVKATILSDSDA
jgi:hypothetical protein